MKMALFAVAAICCTAAWVPATGADYTMVAEDILIMNVFGEPQLSQLRLVVGPDGNVTVPVVGVIKAEGLTPDQLGQEIAKGLKEKKWLKDPQVQMLLIEVHRPKVSVTGNLNRPGAYDFKDGDTVTQAIASAGSYMESAALDKATLTRKTGEVVNIDLYKLYFKGDMTQNLTLRNGDTIYVPEDTVRKIYVLGEVQRPGQYPLKENMTALSAVSLAGGPIQDRGKLKGTMVIRGDPAKPERIAVNITKMIGTGDLSQDVALKPGDVVYVPKSSKPSLRDVADILSVLSSFRYVTQGFNRF